MEPPTTEPPMCLVCWENYDNASTVPRVLPCGHTVCERCLSRLPSHPVLPAGAAGVRCPECNQIERVPPLGPGFLPKNFELLRFLNPIPKRESKPEPESVRQFAPDPTFIPLPWTDSLFSYWSRWILPEKSIATISIVVDETLVLGDQVGLSGGKNGKVSLFPIGKSSDRQSRWFRLSYTARVMEAVCELGETVRKRLGLLLESVERQRRGICRVFGLWLDFDKENADLFLVCERFDRSLFDGKWRLGLETFGEFAFGMVGMEICEVVMGFHSEGIAFGCLVPDCFCFDEYGHCLLDLNRVLVRAMSIREEGGDKESDSIRTFEFLNPEGFVSLRVCDVWILSCLFTVILIGQRRLSSELLEDFHRLHLSGESEFLGQYDIWEGKVIAKLESLFLGTKFESLVQTVSLCLSYHTENRPQVKDIWCCIRNLLIGSPVEDVADSNGLGKKECKDCLVICSLFEDICYMSKRSDTTSRLQGNGVVSGKISAVGLAESVGGSRDHLQQEQEVGDLVNGLQGGGYKSITLQGHLDCISRLAVAGGYLVSSSFDKMINVWSLQNFSLIKSLKGHEHRVLDMTVADETQPLCISCDSGSGIFVWRIDTSLGQELLKKWYVHENDWRHNGVYSLVISGDYLYSGAGDKSIKAWSLQDYSLACTMTGHDAIVSSLAVANGILYSGSWDGTIRLWSLHDHSLLSILRNDNEGRSPFVISLKVGHHLLVSSYENGHIKMWRNNEFLRSMQLDDGPIFALHMDRKWLFTGGWNKQVNILELSENDLQTDVRNIASITCNSAISSLLYWRGKLFVGLSNKDIKVYYCEH